MRAADSLLIDEFADALWLADGLAGNTLAAYRTDLAQFAAWLETGGQGLAEADEAAVNTYLAHLHTRARGFKAASQQIGRAHV